MAGWGTGAWGTGLWGVGESGSLSIERAFAIGPTTVRVVLSRTALDSSALNPLTWRVVNAAGKSLVPIAVERGSSNVEYDIRLMHDLTAYPSQHTVSSETLEDSIGETLVAPKSATFAGLGVSAARSRTAQIDLDSAHVLSGRVPGTLSVDHGGDYRGQSGASLLRKLVIRRLMTMRGGFFHMPTYGQGLMVKETIVSTDLVKLRKEISLQLLEEPEIDSAEARLSLSSSGVLTIAVRARLVTGQEESVSLEVPNG